MAALGATIVSLDHVFHNMATRGAASKAVLLVLNEKGLTIGWYATATASLQEVMPRLRAIHNRPNSQVGRARGEGGVEWGSGGSGAAE
jgi:hypothetical protein